MDEEEKEEENDIKEKNNQQYHNEKKRRIKLNQDSDKVSNAIKGNNISDEEENFEY